ncbi:MAG: DEAD/DEAH box helicase family protein [Candidatus Sericytochromatia bacterium]|nr:DEAD/DEAH box helicase family protein [Candidatus Sericytochromatia bacterium]
MKLKFKIQDYQTQAVQAVVDCFAGQPLMQGIEYRIDPGKTQILELDAAGFKNAELRLSEAQVLENIQRVQKQQNLPLSDKLVRSPAAPINLDVEMETGTGKTYCYIKSIFELHKRYGWRKFIIVVPSIAIREGVYKSLQITAEHFLESYHQRARFFIYNSKQLHQLESFSSDAGINIMVINVQAFNATGKDNRRIYEELDDFQSRKPIDVIKANRPILILDEPQKMEGKKTLEALQKFQPLMILRYSATHKTTHNKIYRLDALDAYNQKLVKKIAVRGISVKGLAGTHAYLYLEGIEVSRQSPVARLEFEVRQGAGIKRLLRKVKKGDNLYDLSNALEQYKQGYVVSEIDALNDSVHFTNGVVLQAGVALGDVNESTLRRIQIREAIRAHLQKEQQLFAQGIKVLSLFFIDEVAKYRQYAENEKINGEYATIFEEEYSQCLQELGLALQPAYQDYLRSIAVEQTHDGYFSIDKRSRRLINSSTNRSGECDDVDAYDLILKDKERLLSLTEPVRFIFSHSALREGWDNPNVFVICTLKHSDNTVSRRQEVGRGLRLSVNKYGERQDHPESVHQTNILTVIANESYQDFVAGLQKDLRESLAQRPKQANEAYFTGKVLQTAEGTTEVTPSMARQIYKYLIKHDYIDDQDQITPEYQTARQQGERAPLPEALQAVQTQVFALIDSVFSEGAWLEIDNDRHLKTNALNENFHKAEFKALWQRINRKAVYSVHFDSNELRAKCVIALNQQLRVKPLQYTIQAGEQRDQLSYAQMSAGEGFQLQETVTAYNLATVASAVSYDLLGKIAEGTQLTRKTIAGILQQLEPLVFAQFKQNPEHFIAEAVRLITEQKATSIIEHLKYNPLEESHDLAIFTEAQANQNLSKAGDPLRKHIYDYVITDSQTERAFVNALDTSQEVVVYAKLPRGFAIPTPVGNYNPDWAIAFHEGAIKHIYFVAETKGSLSSLELREIEKTKINCARRFFEVLNQSQTEAGVRYDVVSNYSQLMQLVGP